MDNHSTNILVVDDNEDFASMCASFFRKLGFSVRTAGNGKAALDILKTCAVDVVISDLTMPEMDGFALGEAITSGNWRLNVRRIAITAQPFDAIEKRARASGFEALFEKPVKMSELVKWIDQNCGLCSI